MHLSPPESTSPAPASPPGGLVDPALPVLAGHFPGNPLVPGALQLEWMLAAVPGGTAPDASWTVRQAKFVKPLRPGTAYQLAIAPQGAGYRVTLAGADGPYATATFERAKA